MTKTSFGMSYQHRLVYDHFEKKYEQDLVLILLTYPNLVLLIHYTEYSVQPKPLFWFRSDTKTKTQLG